MSRNPLVLLCLCAAVVLGVGACADRDAPDLVLESYDLENGLHVILAPDASLPEVAVNVWYHVGSRNETPGRRGFAHVYEHLMFKGSARHDVDLLPVLESLGGRGNGMTNKDRTVYWSVVPPGQLEAALWLEADRMAGPAGGLTGALSRPKLDNQISVILNELRQKADRPYARMDALVTGLLFPPEHPYSWTVAGDPRELAAATLEDVADFHRTWYVPNNASLCVAGNFDPDRARTWIAEHFGPLEAGPGRAETPAAIPHPDGERRLTEEDDVSLPRLTMAWHTPARFGPGDADFDALAFVLAARPTSRLRQALQREEQLAQRVSVRQRSRELGSTFEIEVTAAPDVDPTRVEAVIDAVLEEIRTAGPTGAEVASARAMLEADFLRGFEQIGGFGGRANRLNRYYTFLGSRDDPSDGLADDWQRLQRITPESVRRAAHDWLDPQRRAVVLIAPGSASPAFPEVDRPVDENAPQLPRVCEPLPPAVADDTFVAPRFVSGELENGLRWHVVQREGLPLVEIHVNVRAGWWADGAGLPGTAALTAGMLDKGAAGQSAQEIAARADRLGAVLECGSHFDAALVRLNLPSADLAEGLDLAADLVCEPDFPVEEFELLREEMRGRALTETKRPRTAAIRELQRRLFDPHHPYAQPYTGTPSTEALERIEVRDLRSFHAARYRPGWMDVVFVGDVEPDDVVGPLREAFRSWPDLEPGPARAMSIEGASAGAGGVIVLDRPGSRQTTIVGGVSSLARAHPDREALLLLNQALGRTDAGRLARNLRTRKGLAYQVRSRVISYREGGFFLVETAVDPSRAAEALTELEREIAEIGAGRPVEGRELQDARTARLAGFARGFETLESTAVNLDRLLICGQPPDVWERAPAEIAAADPEALRALAARYLVPEMMTWIVVGDWQVLGPQFEAEGIEPFEVRAF